MRSAIGRERQYRRSLEGARRELIVTIRSIVPIVAHPPLDNHRFPAPGITAFPEVRFPCSRT